MDDLTPPAKVTGASGELLSRLRQALTAELNSQSFLVDAGVVLGVKLGLPDYGLQDAERFLTVLRKKAEKLISLGLLESFLVISIRDELGRWFKHSSDEANAKRAGIRSNLQSLLDDDDRFRAYRRELEEVDPTRGSASDDEIRQGIRKMMDTARPVDFNEDVRALMLEESWRTVSAEYLSDRDISAWEGLHLHPKKT
ncbi:hypothetical protein [Streptomyces sp. NPDC048419]|uniref:hypothetical protein n=1 Tax=Streptomyces sp. NPDC048419 TaxID=3365547 RepID=UPI003711967B